MEDWQKEYEKELAAMYTCGVTGLPCINCSPYGCEHRKVDEVYNEK